MFHILYPSDQRRGAAVEFEGRHRVPAYPFLLVLAPGRGPRLHKDPYSETCIVRSGKAAMTVNGKEVIAGPGDIVVIGPDTPHLFTAIGTEPLDTIAIHANDRIVIEWLSGSDADL